MVAHAIETPCPRCKRPIDVRILGVCTGLGPALVRCACGATAPTWRKEWPRFSAGQRVRFLLASLVQVKACMFAIGVAAVGGLASAWLGG